MGNWTAPEDLLDFLKNYARDEDRSNELGKLLTDFRNKYPREAWREMRLETYVLGTGEKTGYCYDLEFGYRELGSIGGNIAKKFGIYRTNRGDTWFDPRLGSSLEEAWENLRAGFLRMFELADEERWSEIDAIEALTGLPMVRMKTLFVYYPTKVLPINARDMIYHFLLKLNPKTNVERTYDVVTLNRAVLSMLREIEQLRSWSTPDITDMLYTWSDPRKAERIMKIAPGEQAKFWQDCLSNGYICVGWDELGDLSGYTAKDEYRSRFAELYLEMYKNHKATMIRKGNELWRLTELRPGDIVIANNGISSILALGTVQDPPYQWRPERNEYKHTVNVQWDTSQACTVEPQKRWGVTTVLELSPEELTRILGGTTDSGTGPGPSPGPAPITPGRLYERMERELERTGQIILYGPPGTGKTYTTRRFAAWWLAKQSGKPIGLQELATQNIKELENKFKFASAGRVWWMVANPANWSWDQLFKDGSVQYTYGRLHRNFPLVQEGDLVVGYESTPVKRIVALARVSNALGVDDAGELGVRLEPLKKIENGLSYEELQKDLVLKDSEPLRFRNQGTLFALSTDEADYLLSVLNERDPGLQKFLSTEERVAQLTWLTFHASYSYEDFIEGFRPVASITAGMQLRLEDGVFKKICREAVAFPDKPYLVCIDEVNRSNIAKVLGELVTLLEKDKRGMEVILPQSKERFTIPPNVHLVCTMNTADRSIKLLDAAVRRRFSFIEVMPDLDLLEGVEIDGLMLQDFLTELNRRIARREGREKLIGHSYFLKNGIPISTKTDFCDRVRHDILPLLEEYCYDDISALAGMLGDGIIDTVGQTIDESVIGNEDDFFNCILTEFSKHE